MAGVLYDSIIYGPVESRRFGVSLGINLLPEDIKVCTFDCIYCEVGWKGSNNHRHNNYPFHSREDIYNSLESRLIDLKERYMRPDSITFSGNGEPTLHPAFPEIARDLRALRDMYVPEANVTVLSNSTNLNDKRIFDTLMQIDNNVMKLDAGSEKLFELINHSAENINLQEIVDNLKKFQGRLYVQSMFLRGTHRGKYVDNTTEEAVNHWLEHIDKIRPWSVMLYSIDRATPNHTIEKVSHEELEKIANRVRNMNIKASSFS